MATKTRTLGESGLVSIIVTVVLMIIISLITLGFSRIIRREQQQVLDRQLSRQAYYASESGVNDAKKVIDGLLAAGKEVPAKTNCQPDTSYSDATPYTAPNVVDPVRNVTYSCLLVDPAPNSLVYSLSNSAPSTVIPIKGKNGQRLNKLQLQWTSSQPAPLTGCPTSPTGNLPQPAAWSCGYAIVRVDLVPVDVAITRQQLMANTFTAFFMPINSTSGGIGSISYNSGVNIYGGGANQGSLAPARCAPAAQGYCSMTITNLSAAQYYLRVSSVYRDAPALRLYGSDGAGRPLGLTGAQVMIDATGKANDVLQRIQVRVPLINNNGLFSDYGVSSTDSICKYFQVYPGYPNASGC